MGVVIRPASLQEALMRMSREVLLPLAGGTDLMVRHRVPGGTRAQLPGPAISIGHLEELRFLRQAEGRLEMGAACTLAALLESPLVPEDWKLPLAGMGSPAIRNVATLGGNLGNASPAGDAIPMLAALDAQGGAGVGGR
jgi:CO/xanthine dehydrogenase FAD-binding subunit